MKEPIFSHRPFIIGSVKSRAMVRRCADIFHSAPMVLAICASIGMVTFPGGGRSISSNGRALRNARSVPATGGKGNFDIHIAGDYKGVGTATVGASSVHISADQITDDNGNTGSLTADGQMSIDSSHFTGSGTVMGKHFTFDGRADAQDPSVRQTHVGGQAQVKPERIIIFARMMATFQTDDNHFGRIVGQRGSTRSPTQTTSP